MRLSKEREAALRRRKTSNPAYQELFDELDAVRAERDALVTAAKEWIKYPYTDYRNALLVAIQDAEQAK